MNGYDIIRFPESHWHNLHWRIMRNGKDVTTTTTLADAKWWVTNKG